MTTKKTNEIKTGEPFSSLFKIYPDIYNEVFNDMKENGFDPNDPLLIWKEEDILIDGHTRLKATTELKIDEIPVNHISFESEEDAIQYAVKRNANRRSITTGDKLRLIRIIDEVKQRGGKHGNQYISGKDLNLSLCQYDENSDESKKSSEITGKLLNVSPTQVNKMRTLLSYGKESDIEAVETNQMSIDEAWKKAKIEKERIESEKKAEKQVVQTFNRTNDNIEWALWTWNPVTGCKHGCIYCYARDIANRFFGGFEPQFHPKRLEAPQNTPIPSVNEIGEHNVFVCSMADLFGEWVPQSWIHDVFESIRNAPDWWNFLLLTKNPKRYEYLFFPEKCWIGATATNQSQMDTALRVFKQLRKNVKNVLFISCEPLQEEIIIKDDLKCVDWLIIGGRSRSTRMPEGQPEWEWVNHLLCKANDSGTKVYFKPNLTVRPKEYPELKNDSSQDAMDLFTTDEFIEISNS